MMRKYKSLLISLLLILIPNAVMYLIAVYTGTERLILNLDYFLPILLLAYKQRIGFFIIFFIIAFLDFLIIFAQIFPFIRISDLFYLLKFAVQASNTYIAFGLFLLFIVFLESSFIKRAYHPSLNKTLLIVFNILIYSYFLSINFIEQDKSKFWKPSNEQVLGSQSLNYWNNSHQGFVQTYNVTGDAFSKFISIGSTDYLFKSPETQNDKILLIINESWGETFKPTIQSEVLKPILTSVNVQNIEQGILGFSGFTINGEMRELCQKSVIHFNLKDKLEGFGNCLPHILNDLGYKTVAAHGALGLMYDRKHWYPRAGFEKVLFRDIGLNLPNSRCYSFPGNCDIDIASRVREEFESNKDNKLFFYWLTLNTHSTYDKKDLKIDTFDCKHHNIDEVTASCRNLKLQKQFSTIVSNLIANPEMSGTDVIMVGDHEPPIIGNEASVFRADTVPFIRFQVK